MNLKTFAFLSNQNARRPNNQRSRRISSYISFCFILFFASSSFAEKVTRQQLARDIASVEKSITITKDKMKEVGDISFLPDLYFVLADLYHEKSRLLYEDEKMKFPKKNPEDLDMNASRKAKKMAIETYTRFTENYPKDSYVDKAFFNIAMSYRELGQIEDMVNTFIKITKEFPKSKYWEESQLRLGDYFLERKKEFDLAIEVYQKILDRPSNPYIPYAKYKMGWCYINLNNFDKALDIFESVLVVDARADDAGLSEELRVTDIRRDTLIAMVWPYSEIEKHAGDRLKPAAYFENLSPDRVSLVQVLNKLGKRLMVKEKAEAAVPVFARLIEISYDLDVRISAINNFYEAYKKSKKTYNVDKIIKTISVTMSQLRHSTMISASDKKNAENNFEIYLRDLSTALNRQAQQEKSEALYKLSSDIYEDYLILFPKSAYFKDIATNLAEVYYSLGQYARAGYFYEQAYVKSGSNSALLQSSIKAYGQALLESDKLSRLELEESRSGYRDMGTAFVKLSPNDKATVDIRFNIAKIFYDERRFDLAVAEFQKFIQSYPQNPKSKAAIHLILDTYNQREDYKGLIKFGQAIIAGRSPAALDNEFKRDVGEIVKQAQYRTLEDKVGDPRSRDYAKKLLAMGQKYKGSALGDLAIYEAYTNFKKKKDPLVYSAGEQLLEKHADSKYAKEVVGDLGQIAIQSGDFDRAADYFEKFISMYPKDPLSLTLTKSAAVLRENQGDYDAAYEHYKRLNAPFSKLAELLAKSKKWKQLNQLAVTQKSQDMLASYYVGLSLVRLGERKSAIPYFNKVVSYPAQNEEQKTIAAHSLYLRASEALKDYKQLKFGRGDDTVVTQQKGEKLKVLNQYYDKVIAYGNGKWVIGALYELGQSYREFSEFLSQAPVPAGLTPDVVAQYKQAVQTQAEEYKVKSNQYFRSCLTNAEKFEVFTLFVKGCRTGGDYIVDESIDEVSLRKPAGKTNADIQAIRQKLLDKSDQPELVKELGQIYLRSQDYGMAKLAFNRYLEMKPQNAEALAWLGVIEMYSSDFEKAKSYFKTSQHLDARPGLSQLGLAAMYKKFGFQDLYKQISARLPAKRAQYAKIHPWIEEIL